MTRKEALECTILTDIMSCNGMDVMPTMIHIHKPEDMTDWQKARPDLNKLDHGIPNMQIQIHRNISVLNDPKVSCKQGSSSTVSMSERWN